MRRSAFFLIALALFGACSDDAPSNEATVTMAEGQRFTPDVAVVRAGTIVTFVNESSEAHTVTAYDGVPQYFASGGATSEATARDAIADALIGQEASYAVAFDEPGTYEYFCIPHEGQGMRGTIEVEG